MSEEIKNCPFCGSPVNPTRAWYGVADYSVCRCSNPDCPGELNYEFMPAEIWNTRPLEDVLNKRIAELEGELAELKERFDITDGLLNQATVSIGAVIACCTYNSNAEAMAGAYGISYRAFTMIDNFIKNYNRAVLDGKASTDVKNIICWPPNPQEVQE